LVKGKKISKISKISKIFFKILIKGSNKKNKNYKT